MTWNKKGIPHKGWRNEGETDLGPEKTRNASVSAKCEMCGQRGLRWVHQMVHPDYGAVLSVGRVCAAKMVEDYVSAKRTGTPADSDAREQPLSVSG